jgi:hypothetical protein
MHFNGEITLGSILTIVTLLGIALRFAWTAGALQAVIIEHTKRLDRYEIALTEIVSSVQRVIGRVEGVQDRLDAIVRDRS